MRIPSWFLSKNLTCVSLVHSLSSHGETILVDVKQSGLLLLSIRKQFFPKALRAKGSRLVVWGSGGRGRGRPWGIVGVTSPVQRGVRFVLHRIVSCSVALVFDFGAIIRWSIQYGLSEGVRKMWKTIATWYFLKADRKRRAHQERPQKKNKFKNLSNNQ